MKIIYLFIALLLVAFDAQAATIYVDNGLGVKGGNCIGTYDVNTRTCIGLSTSYATPQAAANATSAGGNNLVLIRGGTYTNPGGHVLNIGISGSGLNSMITYQAYPGETPIMQGDFNPLGADQYPIWIHANWIVIDGLQASNGTYAIYVDNSTDNTIKNCEASFARGTGLFIYGSSSTRNLAQNCKVHDNAQANFPRGTVATWGAGLFIGYGAHANTAQGNFVYFNHGEGLSTGVESPDNVFDGNWVADNFNVNIYSDGGNNTIIRNNVSWVTPEAKAIVKCCTGGGNSAATGINLATEQDTGNGSTLTGLRVYNNIVINSLVGIELNSNDGFPGNTHNFTDIRIWNNTLIRNGNCSRLFGGGGTFDGITFANNLCIEEGANAQALIWVDPLPTNRSFQNNFWYGTNNIITGNGGNPQFVTYASGAATIGFTNTPAGTTPPTTDPLIVDKTVIPPRLWNSAYYLYPTGAASTASLNKNAYQLQPASKAINAGTANIVTGSISVPACPTNAPNCYYGTAPDIGAAEVAASSFALTITGPTSNSAYSTSSPTPLTLSGTSTQSGGSVAWTCDRCGALVNGLGGPGSGSTSGGVANWTSTPITLKSGINIITVTGTDGSGNVASDSITVTYAPSFPGNTRALALGFEEAPGTTATDSSVNKNDGTLNGAPTRLAGKFGNGISLNGTSQYINVPDANSLDFTQGFSVGLWVNPAAIHHDDRVAIVKNYVIALYAAHSGCNAGNPLIYMVTNGNIGPSFQVCGSSPLPVGTPSYLMATYDGANLKLYVNGVLASSTPAFGYMEPTANSLQIGASQYGEYFDGMVDEVQAFNFALPLTAASNTVAGAGCTTQNRADQNSVNTALWSVVGAMNCSIIATTPPTSKGFPASATGLRTGAVANSMMMGAQ